MKIKNLTPHDVKLCLANGVDVVIPRSGEVARVKTARLFLETLWYEDEKSGKVEIPLHKTAYGEVEGLPDQEDGVLLIVGSLVLQALQAKLIQRKDIVAPDTSVGGVVRDGDGSIVGVRGFQRLF